MDKIQTHTLKSTTLLEMSKRLSDDARILHDAGLRAIVAEMGLVAGKTRVQQGELVGRYEEILNYVRGQIYIGVRLEEPIDGRWTKKFYGDWKVID